MNTDINTAERANQARTEEATMSAVEWATREDVSAITTETLREQYSDRAPEYAARHLATWLATAALDALENCGREHPYGRERAQRDLAAALAIEIEEHAARLIGTVAWHLYRDDDRPDYAQAAERALAGLALPDDE